jgi:hypothetical protein
MAVIQNEIEIAPAQTLPSQKKSALGLLGDPETVLSGSRGAVEHWSRCNYEAALTISFILGRSQRDTMTVLPDRFHALDRPSFISFLK